MSVTISEYLTSHDNKLAALLKSEDLSGIFLNDTLINIVFRHDEWWCDIFPDYTLTCNDLNAMATAFAGYWWCISPTFGGSQYSVSIDLGTDML